MFNIINNKFNLTLIKQQVNATNLASDVIWQHDNRVMLTECDFNVCVLNVF